MSNVILVSYPVVERENPNHSCGRISWTVDRQLMRSLLSGLGVVN